MTAAAMTPRERFLAVLNFRSSGDRLPMVEWAAWWDQTRHRWEGEGLPAGLAWEDSVRYFDLDVLVCLGAHPRGPDCPQPAHHGGSIITDEASYERIRPHLFPDAAIASLVRSARELQPRHARGELIIRIWLDGFFWFPRTLFGIENHLYAFYDQPALMHRINADLTAFNLKAVAALCEVLKPDMVGLAEDMSYNNGPMLSRQAFNEFLLPYYQRMLPAIKDRGIKVLIDSDGDITTMIPWMLEAGIEGVYPLERQAGVDVAAIRRDYPAFLMMGAYDKMVMPLGESAMRAEFERLLPVMRSGGFIPSVDHQTPPGVSLENYRCYVRLFREYARRGAGG